MGIDIVNLTFEKWLWSLVGIEELITKDKRSESPPIKRGSGLKNPLIQKCLATHTPPYRYVITYYYLGKELSSPGERSRLFQNILKGLRWTKGILFLPHNYNIGEKIEDTAAQFWDTIGTLKQKGNPISYILIFGRDSASSLLSVRECTIGPLLWKGNRVMVLPSPEDMLPDNREAKNLVWHFLKRLPVP